jgi:hypothetical protein
MTPPKGFNIFETDPIETSTEVRISEYDCPAAARRMISRRTAGGILLPRYRATPTKRAIAHLLVELQRAQLNEVLQRSLESAHHMRHQPFNAAPKLTEQLLG